MTVKKIANLEQRLERWKEKRTYWLKKEVPVIVGVSVVVNALCFYAALFVADSFPFIEVWIIPLIGFLIMIPPLKMTYPSKPKQDDVEKDIKLREAFGMDTTVSGHSKREN